MPSHVSTVCEKEPTIPTPKKSIEYITECSAPGAGRGERGVNPVRPDMGGASHSLVLLYLTTEGIYDTKLPNLVFCKGKLKLLLPYSHFTYFLTPSCTPRLGERETKREGSVP